MAIVAAMAATVTSAVIGNCHHCALELYAGGPIVTFADGRIAHVACTVHARRRDIAQ